MLVVLVAVLAGATVFLCAKTAAVSNELISLLKNASVTVEKVNAIADDAGEIMVSANSIVKKADVMMDVATVMMDNADVMIKNADGTLQTVDEIVDMVYGVMPDLINKTLPEINQMMLDINYYFSLMASQFTDMSDAVVNAPMLKMFGGNDSK